MSKALPLWKLVDAMETASASDEWEVYINRETGEMALITDEVRSTLDKIESEEDIERLGAEDFFGPNEIEYARAEAGSGDLDVWVTAPDKFDFHEYRHMERFIITLPEGEVQEDLSRAIKGKGAFRYFKDTALRHGVIDAWYAYRNDAQKEFVRDWAEGHGIEVVDAPRQGPPGLL